MSEPAVPPSPVAAIRLGMAGAIGVAVVAGILVLAALASGVMILVFVAILLGAGLRPLVDQLRTRLPIGRGTSILITYGLFLLAVVAFGLVAVPTAVHQIDDLAARLPSLLASGREWAQGLRPAMLASSVEALIDAAAGEIAPSTAARPDQVVAFGITVAEAAVTIATLVTLVYFWLTEQARLQRYVLAFLPLDRRGGAREAWDDVDARLGMWVRGQLTIMATIALGTGILYTILGLPSALLLGLFAGLAEAIPLVGPIIGAIPALVVAGTVSPELAGVVALAYVAIQFIEGNVLVPRVMRHTIQVSSFLVIVSLLVGAAAGGVIGAFLAVPIVAAAEVVLQRLQAREVPITQAPAVDAEPEEDEAPPDPARARSEPPVVVA